MLASRCRQLLPGEAGIIWSWSYETGNSTSWPFDGFFMTAFQHVSGTNPVLLPWLGIRIPASWGRDYRKVAYIIDICIEQAFLFDYLIWWVRLKPHFLPSFGRPETYQLNVRTIFKHNHCLIGSIIIQNHQYNTRIALLRTITFFRFNHKNCTKSTKGK